MREYTRIAFFEDRGFRMHRDLPTSGALLASGTSSVPTFGAPRRVPVMQSIVSLDTSYSSTLPDALSRPPETAPIVLTDDEPLRLRVFIDKSIVEIFVNDQQCIAAPGLPRTGRQHRRIAASPRLRRHPGIARRLADVEHLRVGRGKYY